MSCIGFFFTFCLLRGTHLTSVHYLVGKPEYICDKGGQIKEMNSNTTNILLPEKETAVFRVFFQKVSKECKNQQRCNLIFWNTVRDFERHLNSEYSKTNDGVIRVNNSMLVSGIKYLINISLRRKDKSIHDMQVVLDMVDNNNYKNTMTMEKPIASVSMTAPPSTYIFSDIIVIAEASICSNNFSDYFFQWTLLDGSSVVHKFSERSSDLLIPGNIFPQAGKSYKIMCELLNMDNKQEVTNQSVTVVVEDTPINAKENIILQLSCQHTTVNINTPVSVKAYIFDLFDQDEGYTIKWSCTPTDINKLCDDVNSTYLYIDQGFSEVNNYTITVDVSTAKQTKSATCVVIVMNDVPTINFDIAEFPIKCIEGLEIIADVNGLRTFCNIRWASDKLDLQALPGNPVTEYNVTVMGDTFLAELEDFSVDTVRKEYRLAIASPSSQWKGLTQKFYEFTLTITCPSILDVTDNTTVKEYCPENFITTSACIKVETLEAPVLNGFEVLPSSGIAFDTLFVFESKVPPSNPPFIYKFGYEYSKEKLAIIFYTGGNPQTSTRLPYDENGLQMFLVVCDYVNSCTKVYGAVVELQLPSKEVIEKEKVAHKFKLEMNIENYYKAFSFALAVLHTTTYLDTDDVYKSYFSEEINDKIENLVGSNIRDEFWTENVNRFIAFLSDFSKYLFLSEEVLNNLIKLRNEISSANKAELKNFQRKLLSSSGGPSTLNNFKNFIDISEMVITSSSDKLKVDNEKQNVLNTLNEYFPKLCLNVYEKNKKIRFEFKTILIGVEKLIKTSLDTSLNIPFEQNTWNKTAVLKFLRPHGSNEYCLAKLAFKSYFSNNEITFAAKLVQFRSDSNIEVFDTTHKILLPIDQRYFKDFTATCTVSSNNFNSTCSLLKQTSSFAQFQCSSLGVYFLDYEKASAHISLSPTDADKLLVSSKATTAIALHGHTEITQRINSSSEINTFITGKTNTYAIISYVVTFSSVVGIAILCYIIKKLSTRPSREVMLDSNDDYPQYASLFQEETLY